MNFINLKDSKNIVLCIVILDIMLLFQEKLFYDFVPISNNIPLSGTPFFYMCYFIRIYTSRVKNILSKYKCSYLTLSLGNVLSMFLNFSLSQPQRSYKKMLLCR